MISTKVQYKSCKDVKGSVPKWSASYILNIESLTKGVGRKISRGGGNQKKTENSTIKPLTTISVSCMKIQVLPAADAHVIDPILALVY